MSDVVAEEKPKGSNPDKPKTSRRRDKKDKANQIIKIVVRHLPPTMTETEFLEQVGPLPDNEYYYFCPADWSLGQEATCRAYIDMSLKDISDVLQFRDRFDGYVFLDNKGSEYMAIVEYAPFQSFLKNKARNDDAKVNTIESEPHYQEFIQRLADEREEASRLGDVKIDFNFERRLDENCKSTPLLQYLANKKEKRREEARKRNEEKRKQREEQKQLRQGEQGEASKSKEVKETGAGGDNKKSVKKETKDPQTPAQGAETGKASRSKRRTERDQRRREEHELRKQARERDFKDKKDKKPDRQDKPEKEKGPNGKQGKKQPKDLSKTDKDIVILKKEAKPDTTDLPSTSKESTVEQSTENSEVADSVKKFIQAAGSIADKEETPVAQEPTGNSKKVKEDPAKSNNFRSSEERRIRNKDRPARAIYQPKARLQTGSDESRQNATKDASEGEGDGPDERTYKKNRRAGRRHKQKPQENKESQADDGRRLSKSSESSHSAHSASLAK
ncbi:regulator of nonsense transcripts 3B [Drosophila bipectinata]|uniref:regulator of nonsense transcripts 3B n=1 Tax=Drosophila bipectinata TaxID=42026 RepID=UPI001C899E1E|nr:regulator of nonsense transcripts 3B [Drosophila bipectinata]